MLPSDTIAAISSSIGPAARMIVRMSGPSAHQIAAQLTRDRLPAPSSAARVDLSFANLTFPAWLYLFSAPRSYTTEDLIEFHIAGNPLLARLLLDHLITLSARHATPGEFTARAYFSGRLDLSEAEGVAATIAASNEDELRAARQLLAGELSKRLRPLMDLLAETLALIEVGIDFSDEDVTFLAAEEIQKRLTQVEAQLANLVETSARFERLSHEPHIVLVGRPNAGKSTLLNTLAGHSRAVVSPIPGTTRDALWAHVRLKRGLVRLTDVAGFEGPHAAVRGMGVSPMRPDDAGISNQTQSQSLKALESADYVLLLHDITDPEPLPVLPRSPDLLILTKSDLTGSCDACVAPAISHTRDAGVAITAISSHTGAGLDELKARLDTLAFGSAATSSSLALTARHLTAITDARAGLHRALSNLQVGQELLALDLRESLDALGQILGSVSPDELLGRIFSTFCIGK